MNEEEKKAIEFIKDLIAWDVRQDLCPNKEECENLEIILNLIEKLQKENEELKNLMAHKNGYTEMLEKDLFENCSNYVISKQKIKDKIEELKKEYNKLDKQVDEYIKSVEKDVSTYYENKERISIMQTLSYFIGILQELIEEREENNG